MSSISLFVPRWYQSYKNWVVKHPKKVSDFETTVKWISYFAAGRVNNSYVVSELVYASSNLLVFFNDRLIKSGRKIELQSSGERIKLWLTVLEYMEVFLELSANKQWGPTGKWIVIVSIQLFKCVCRLILIYHHKEGIIQNPPIPILNRNDFTEDVTLFQDTTVADVAQRQLESVSFTLKRSGKIIRKIESSAPVTLRSWKPLGRSHLENEQTVEQALAGRQLCAEVLYVTKPIVHLCVSGCLGYNTWNPWIVSLLMDLGSLHLYKTCNKIKTNSLSPKQRLLLSRRTIILILYLLRSPFYDRHSKQRIESFLKALSRKVPLTSLICTPLLKYLPFWQQNYFYMWST